jgi:glutathione synthase/RimK-type ligase-like ATP-grasp enzyme
MLAQERSACPRDGLHVTHARLPTESDLAQEQEHGRVVINGATCHRLGYDKLEQAALFKRCGVATPLTRPVVAQERAIPDRAVLVKPLAGSYGRGILPIPCLRRGS